MSRTDVVTQLVAVLGPQLGTFPVDHLVEEFIETYGAVSVDNVPDEDVWNLIEKYDTF